MSDPSPAIDPATRDVSDVAAAARQAAHKRKRDAAAPSPPAKKQAKDAGRPSCTHEVAVPKSYTNPRDGDIHGDINNPRYAGKMAKEYPFVLDPFQEKSIACLERNESVMVAAHTSAGKTVIAEYAIAMAFRDNQKVIYTSPLKALSNQKFRELSEEFDDVGIMTGDVCIKENATCVVMTTEIMRSMMYKNSEIMREVQWVIFDEVHYMKDRERGVVWEESMIFLPPAARMVFLSATLSNSLEFAEWVCHLHSKPCHVVYTDQRPTPLQHYAFPQGGSGLFLVCDAERQFREENFAQVVASFEHQAGKGGKGGGRDGGRGSFGKGQQNAEREAQKSDVLKLVKLVQDKRWDPVIVFAFNRRECEAYAGQMVSTKMAEPINFNSAEEQAAVEDVFNCCMAALTEDDRELPAVQQMLGLLKRGVGVHHSGLLPIVKELVEILFTEGLIKCLFATETFAMGLNMPARTVVFTQLRKWDGEEHRWMASGEYIQMSGRAGRRGMDERGNVIMMVDDKMDEAVCREMVSGKPLPLASSFRLSFYTLLNLMTRMDGQHNMEHVIKNSFHQFQHERRLPQIEAEARALEEEAATIQVEGGEEVMEEYARLRAQIEDAEREILAHMLRPEHVLSYLKPGRLLRVRSGGRDWGWGILVVAFKVDKGESSAKGRPGEGGASSYRLDVLLNCAPLVAGEAPQPAPPGGQGEMQVLPVPLPMVTGVGTLRTNLPDDLRKPEARASVGLQLKKLLERFKDGLPKVDPVEDMGLDDPDLRRAVRRVAELEPQLMANPVFRLDLEEERKSTLLREKAALRAKAKAMRRRMEDSQIKIFRDEARHRTAVLRRLGYVDHDGVVQLKGRAACEVDTADELVAVELMMDGAYRDLDIHETVALASILLPTEKSNEEVKLKGALAGALQKVQETARMIGEVEVESKLDVDVQDFVDSFKPTMMDVVYHWSKGEKFAKVCEMTDVFEGTIIRFVRRLDELLSELCSAANVVGDKELAGKFQEGAKSIRRDIIFAPSLYL